MTTSSQCKEEPEHQHEVSGKGEKRYLLNQIG